MNERNTCIQGTIIILTVLILGWAPWAPGGSSLGQNDDGSSSNLGTADYASVGGGLSNIPRWYQRVPKLWARWVFSDRVDTALLCNRHGDSSGVRGAAWLGG